jgi:hypothetical protein
MTDLSAVYVNQPDIPAGMTVGEYRRSRARRRGRLWRLVVSVRMSAL